MKTNLLKLVLIGVNLVIVLGVAIYGVYCWFTTGSNIHASGIGITILRGETGDVNLGIYDGIYDPNGEYTGGNQTVSTTNILPGEFYTLTFEIVSTKKDANVTLQIEELTNRSMTNGIINFDYKAEYSKSYSTSKWESFYTAGPYYDLNTGMLIEEDPTEAQFLEYIQHANAMDALEFGVFSLEEYLGLFVDEEFDVDKFLESSTTFEEYILNPKTVTLPNYREFLYLVFYYNPNTSYIQEFEGREIELRNSNAFAFQSISMIFHGIEEEE